MSDSFWHSLEHLSMGCQAVTSYGCINLISKQISKLKRCHFTQVVRLKDYQFDQNGESRHTTPSNDHPFVFFGDQEEVFLKAHCFLRDPCNKKEHQMRKQKLMLWLKKKEFSCLTRMQVMLIHPENQECCLKDCCEISL